MKQMQVNRCFQKNISKAKFDGWVTKLCKNQLQKTLEKPLLCIFLILFLKSFCSTFSKILFQNIHQTSFWNIRQTFFHNIQQKINLFFMNFFVTSFKQTLYKR